MLHAFGCHRAAPAGAVRPEPERPDDAAVRREFFFVVVVAALLFERDGRRACFETRFDRIASSTAGASGTPTRAEPGTVSAATVLAATAVSSATRPVPSRKAS